MGGFAQSFEKSYNISSQKSSDATLEAIKEKIKLDQTKNEEAQSVVAMKVQMASMRDAIAQKGGDTASIDNILVGLDKVNKKEVIEPIFKAVLDTAKQGPYDALINQGKAAEAANNIREAGGTPPAINLPGTTPQQATTAGVAQMTQAEGQPQTTTSAESDLIPEKANVAGVPTSFKFKSTMAAEEQAKVDAKNRQKVQKAENTSVATQRFMQQFQRSYDELKAFDPNVGETGVGGFLTGQTARIAEHLNELPETKALKIQVLPLAQEIAAELEGGRVTDQDRKIQADKFANAISFPTVTNIRLMSNGYIEMIDKGGNERGKITSQLKEFAKSDSDIFRRVIAQVLMEYPDMAKDIYGEGFEVVDED